PDYVSTFLRRRGGAARISLPSRSDYVSTFRGGERQADEDAQRTRRTRTTCCCTGTLFATRPHISHAFLTRGCRPCDACKSQSCDGRRLTHAEARARSRIRVISFEPIRGSPLSPPRWPAGRRWPLRGRC